MYNILKRKWHSCKIDHMAGHKANLEDRADLPNTQMQTH